MAWPEAFGRVARGRVVRAVTGMAVAIAMATGPARVAGAEPIVAQGSAPPPGIAVNGESTVMAAPDQAYLTVGVQTSARTAREASSSNATRVAAVVEAVTRAGIPPSAIRTVGLSLRPIYGQRTEPATGRGPAQGPAGDVAAAPAIAPGEVRAPVITGYEATNQLEVTIADVTQAGEILDAAIGAGANLAGNLRFTLKDDSEVVARALREAAADARARADAIAAGLGTRVTGILSASDESGGVVRPMDAVAPRAMAGFAAERADTPVSGGELSFRGHVRVTFTIGG